MHCSFFPDSVKDSDGGYGEIRTGPVKVIEVPDTRIVMSVLRSDLPDVAHVIKSHDSSFGYSQACCRYASKCCVIIAVE